MVVVNQDWPVAELDPVRRMRIIATATPGVAYAEKLIPAPFSAVWEAASDLENELPRMITDLRSFEITSTRGERITANARGRFGQRARFDVVLRPGWCLMQSQFLVGGMAADLGKSVGGSVGGSIGRALVRGALGGLLRR